MSEIAETTEPRKLRNDHQGREGYGQTPTDVEFARRLMRLVIVMTISILVWGGVIVLVWMLLT